MAGKFENKVVVVTGGTSGIGFATAKRLATEGASVFITGRRQEELDVAVKTIGGRVSGVRADMSKLADIDRLYDAIQQKHSQIDVLFTNAGGGSMLPLDRVVEAVDVGQLRHVGAHAAHSSADRPDCRVQLFLATAGDEHGRALGREALGGGKADAAGPAGHDDHLVLEFAGHLLSP